MEKALSITCFGDKQVLLTDLFVLDKSNKSDLQAKLESLIDTYEEISIQVSADKFFVIDGCQREVVSFRELDYINHSSSSSSGVKKNGKVWSFVRSGEDIIIQEHWGAPVEKFVNKIIAS